MRRSPPTLLPAPLARLALAALALVVGLAPAGPRAAEAARTPAPMTAELMWKLKRLAAPAISPDGKWAVLQVTSYDLDKDKGLTDLWLVRTDGGETRQLTSHEGPETSPAWSPDGRHIAFVGKRGEDEAGQLYVIPFAGGEARRVTSVATGANAPKWFPDSKRLLFSSAIYADVDGWDAQAKKVEEQKKAKAVGKVWDRAPARIWDRLNDGRDVHVFQVSIDGGEPKAITRGTGLHLPPGEFGPSGDDFDVSPDGEEVAFVADTDPSGVDGKLDVFTVPAAGGKARNLTAANVAGDRSPLYSPDGRFIAFGRQVTPRFWADRVRIVLHDRATGQERVLTEAWDRSASGLAWAPDSKALFGSIDDAGTRRLWRFDVAGGKPAPVTKARSYGAPVIAREGTAVALREAFDEPPTLVRVDLASGEATKLSTFNDALLAGVDLGRYESVTYAGAGGAPIQMWVVYPPGFDPAKKYPLYLLLHGGPHVGITDGFAWRWNAQVFGGWGYVTGWHNFHGSSGFGQGFTDSINPDWATKPYEDTLAAARWFSSKPWIDAGRMSAGGGSYGGYLASLILGRPHPFKSLVAHAGVYDLYNQYASDYGASRKRFPEFWENERWYRQTSPHLQAARFATPTLVIHGGLDYRVPDSHGFALFNALQNKGVKSRLLYFANENHWVLKPQNSLQWYAETRRWLDETLPAPATAPVAGR